MGATKQYNSTNFEQRFIALCNEIRLAVRNDGKDTIEWQKLFCKYHIGKPKSNIFDGIEYCNDLTFSEYIKRYRDYQANKRMTATDMPRYEEKDAEQIELTDADLVAELRRRGYDVTATKTTTITL